MKTLQPEELGAAIEDHCNTFDRTGDWILIKRLMNAHRTIQQTMMQLIVRIILEFAHCHDTHNYDMRNETACAFASKMRDFMIKEQMIFVRGDVVAKDGEMPKYDIYLPCI